LKHGFGTQMATMDNCIFCKIVRGEIPSRKVYEDDLLYAFHDIHPLAQVHFMLVPKEHIGSMAQLAPQHEPVMGRIMVVAQRLARQEGSPEGFRTIVNTGRIGRQEVMHLHVHVLGGTAVLPPMLVPT
jgi:histidine triad (HIT) family protein